MIQLSDHFTYRKLLRYTFPSIIMIIITSIYGVVDGLFVSNFVGKTAFAAVNFILPFVMILGCTGFMFGSGAGALIAKTMGERHQEKANEIFSLVIYVSFGVSFLLFIVGNLLLRPVAVALGAEGRLLDDCMVYGRVYLLGVPAGMLQYEFQYLFSTAGKPKLGLYVTLAAGICNMVLDALFVGYFSWGLAGAAAATVLSQCVGGVLPVLYFCRKNSSLLRLTKTKFDGQALIRTCTNGISELLNNISWAVVGMLYNVQLLRYAGEDGVAAYGVIMYVCLLFLGVFIGYTVGISPIVGYQYGAQNHAELHSLLKKTLVILGVFSVAMCLCSVVLAKPFSRIFVGYDPTLLEMTVRGFEIYAFSYLFAGYATLGSSFFTALNDGLVSALLSILRAFLFQTISIIVLPMIWGLDGIWGATIAAEGLACLAVFGFLLAKQKKYHY